MALFNNPKQKITFVNISRGKLYVKEKDKEPEYFTELSGYITKVEFRIDEYNGKTFEVAEFHLIDDNERYVLKLRTDSGYFRGLSNSIKSGNPKDKFSIIPSSKEENGKTKTTCFVKQNGYSLKHAHTIGNMGDLPQVEKIIFKGQEVWDSSKQLDYWKKYLTSENWHVPTYKFEKQPEPEIIPEQDDDLPF